MIRLGFTRISVWCSLCDVEGARVDTWAQGVAAVFWVTQQSRRGCCLLGLGWGQWRSGEEDRVENYLRSKSLGSGVGGRSSGRPCDAGTQGEGRRMKGDGGDGEGRAWVGMQTPGLWGASQGPKWEPGAVIQTKYKAWESNHTHGSESREESRCSQRVCGRLWSDKRREPASPFCRWREYTCKESSRDLGGHLSFPGNQEGRVTRSQQCPVHLRRQDSTVFTGCSDLQSILNLGTARGDSCMR